MNLPQSLQFLRPGWWGIHAVAVALVAAAGFAAGAHHRGSDAGHAGHAAPPPQPEGGNPVQSEMRLLVEALSTAPASFGAGDLRPLAHRLHAVHAAKEKTAAAIAGGRYRPPRNADAIARFEELDREFHAHLEALVEHSANSEIAPAAHAYGEVLAACNGCHREFAASR